MTPGIHQSYQVESSLSETQKFLPCAAPFREERNETTASMEGDEEGSSSYSSQEIALALAPKFSALLSIFGSSFIMYDVMFKTGKAFSSSSSPHYRILLGMSACTFVVSFFGFFMSTWPIPSHENVFWASGNQATCNAQGFFSQFSLTVVMYNASLSAYYKTTIRDQGYSLRFPWLLEPLLHIIPLTVGIGTASAGIALDLYNSNGWECWISEYPSGCDESWRQNGSDIRENTTIRCERGDNASYYRLILYYIFLWLAILFVLRSMYGVYRCVYAQEKKMNAYNFQYLREREFLVEREKVLKQVSDPDFNADSDSDNSSGGSMASQGSMFSVASAASFAIRSLNTATTLVHRVTIGSVKGMSKMKRRNDSLKRHFRKSRAVAQQGYWFCGACLVTWLFPTISALVSVISPKSNFFALDLLTSLFLPIQGFFNYLVYIQPRLKKTNLFRRCFPFCSKRKEHQQQQSDIIVGGTSSNPEGQSGESSVSSSAFRQSESASFQNDSSVMEAPSDINHMDETTRKRNNRRRSTRVTFSQRLRRTSSIDKSSQQCDTMPQSSNALPIIEKGQTETLSDPTFGAMDLSSDARLGKLSPNVDVRRTKDSDETARTGKPDIRRKEDTAEDSLLFELAIPKDGATDVDEDLSLSDLDCLEKDDSSAEDELSNNNVNEDLSDT